MGVYIQFCRWFIWKSSWLAYRLKLDVMPIRQTRALYWSAGGLAVTFSGTFLVRGSGGPIKPPFGGDVSQAAGPYHHPTFFAGGRRSRPVGGANGRFLTIEDGHLPVMSNYPFGASESF